MRGYPHVLNSRQDYNNVIEDFGYNEKVKRHYQGLLNSATKWQFDKVLDSEDEADEGDDYKTMEEEERGLVQYKKVTNENGKIFRLGFTVEEVKEVIEKCSQ